MKPKDSSTLERRLSLLAPLVLVGIAILLACFYAILYRHDNIAPEVDLSRFSSGPQPGFEYGTDKCRVMKSKLAVSGWLLRKGKGTHRRSTRVVLVEAGGRAYSLDTALRERPGLAGLAGESGTNAQPLYAGFSASLDPSIVNRPIRDGRMYVIYDDASIRVMLPLQCRVRWP
ncbi:MAG: hypothetical protein ABWY34_03830 [Pseudoxanthomonas sp.]